MAFVTDPSVTHPRGIAAADLDGDGDVDLISANNGSNNLSIFRQSSPGTFDSAPILLSYPSLVGPVGVAVADLDGDGDVEVLAAYRQIGGQHQPDLSSLAWFLQSASGRFASPPTVLSGPTLNLDDPDPDVSAGDIDQDGEVDLVFGGTGFVGLLYNNHR